MQWVKLPTWKVGDHEFVLRSGIQNSKTQMFFSRSLVKIQYCGEPLWPREVGCSASDRQGSNFVSSHSSHHPQKVLLAHFSLYVHKGGLKRLSFIHSFIHFNWLKIEHTKKFIDTISASYCHYRPTDNVMKLYYILKVRASDMLDYSKLLILTTFYKPINFILFWLRNSNQMVSYLE